MVNLLGAITIIAKSLLYFEISSFSQFTYKNSKYFFLRIFFFNIIYKTKLIN